MIDGALIKNKNAAAVLLLKMTVLPLKMWCWNCTKPLKIKEG